jgi:hypothetical protein
MRRAPALAHCHVALLRACRFDAQLGGGSLEPAQEHFVPHVATGQHSEDRGPDCGRVAPIRKQPVVLDVQRIERGLAAFVQPETVDGQDTVASLAASQEDAQP